MYQKFIINQDGVLKFGTVYLHRDLLSQGERCVYGGGLWKIDNPRQAIILYGRSFDFGPPDFDYIHKIDWTGIGGKPHQLLFLPRWPNEEEIIPITVKPF
jgi:hypothetical protein